MTQRFRVKTVLDCWLIARDTAEAFQRKMNQVAKKRNSPRWQQCKIGRDTADRIAARIQYGRRHR